ncbi:zinc-ribbon domain-containing protein [Streptomyces sp. ODS28]|uniref:zinc-ribbon domain-containing protein n=1 Tax=Streptomyces sp. ODS28 TaxID=3136688 RepID=UPI0031EAC95D
MIIFGTSSKVMQLAMLNLLCGFCGNPSAHALRKRVTKFSLFFIPLFPIAPAKHSLQCTFCGGHSELSKENAEQLLQQGGGAPQGPPQGMPPQGNPYAGQGPAPQQGGGNPYGGPYGNPYQS